MKVAKVLSTAFAIATILLLISSALLIANTIRLSIFSRRREIEVMKLVGATNWFVRGPFMLEGLICGIVGSLLAIFLLFVAKELVLQSIVGRLDNTLRRRGVAVRLDLGDRVVRRSDGRRDRLRAHAPPVPQRLG